MGMTVGIPRALPAQRGQSLPVVLMLLSLGAAGLVLFYNVGQQTIAKSRVVNAADAAAYSGAAWTAQRLNFMAYTNRAMVANHVAVGHLISFTSWLRYVEDSTDKLQKVTWWIPYVGEAIAEANQAVDAHLDVTEQTAAVYVPAADAVNDLYRLAQAEARLDLRPSRVDDVMAAVVREHDSAMAVNDDAEIGDVPAPFDSRIRGLMRSGQLGVFTAVKGYDASSDDGRIRSLVEMTMDNEYSLSRWIDGRRGWQQSFIAIKLRKQGETAHTLNADGAEWEASDAFQDKTFNFSKMKWGSWSTLASGSASVTEFDSSYRGISGYHNLDYEQQHDSGFPLVAVVTLPRADVAQHDGFGMTAQAAPLAYASAPGVRFERPTACGSPGSSDCARGLEDDQDEYANLFNPFWRARLTDVGTPMAAGL